MKKHFSLVVGLMTLVLISCQKEDSPTIKETGTLMVDIGLSVREHEVNKGLKAFVPLSDFKVTVYRADGAEAMIFETVSVMPESIELQPGNYYVVAHSDNNLPADFDNPYYYGVSEVFTISSNMHQSVSLTCMLANTLVSVVWSDNIVSSFADYSATVTSLLGSLVFNSTETRTGYFQPSPLDILVELRSLNPDGTENLKTLSGSIPDPQPGMHYEIFVNTGIDHGSGTFLVLLDETEIPVEVVEITDKEDDQQDGAIKYGEILITEIMFDPVALSDTQGEWFEIVNQSNRSINLQNLVLDRDGTNIHTIMEPIELLPGEYFVLARTATATNAANTYVYGTSITLSNTGAVLSIYNEAEVTGQGELIFSVNYGASNFPAQPGASLSLNPDLLNAADAVLGSSWCISSSAYNTGDLGTPGAVNDGCL